jgi:uncharacterized ParB-like nuclease family protein
MTDSKERPLAFVTGASSVALGRIEIPLLVAKADSPLQSSFYAYGGTHRLGDNTNRGRSNRRANLIV